MRYILTITAAIFIVRNCSTSLMPTYGYANDFKTKACVFADLCENGTFPPKVCKDLGLTPAEVAQLKNMECCSENAAGNIEYRYLASPGCKQFYDARDWWLQYPPPPLTTDPVDTGTTAPTTDTGTAPTTDTGTPTDTGECMLPPECCGSPRPYTNSGTCFTSSEDAIERGYTNPRDSFFGSHCLAGFCQCGSNSVFYVDFDAGYDPTTACVDDDGDGCIDRCPYLQCASYTANPSCAALGIPRWGAATEQCIDC